MGFALILLASAMIVSIGAAQIVVLSIEIEASGLRAVTLMMTHLFSPVRAMSRIDKECAKRHDHQCNDLNGEDVSFVTVMQTERVSTNPDELDLLQAMEAYCQWVRQHSSRVP